ncbi:NADP-dependent oxidoreductase [Mucilaginibacter sp. UR6-1]|uniref:NADP-dependent oxidoreductase n=1 Tax=Mucilaginibacter sp. UR6-1 TaxID=1435643 RepID=UPI001E2A5501|nr:NADP-dependent oxidoreductase [Mucilaginibacter sp. UR6-1]MCC8407447.1 NADP-dependent oxidoreductase [Mucilaginibacter sp. UR6-1]
MKTYILNEPGDTTHLQISDQPKPRVSGNDVLVRVKAISINPVDVKTRAGKGVYGRLKTLDPIIIGWDIAGIVEETGDQVTGFKAGDEVFGMINFPGHGKAYAEYVSAPARHLALKPANISFEDAAAATLAALTAYQVLVKKAGVQAGDKVLIHAASGGVGHFAAQIANHLGARVTGTSSAQNRDFVLSLGINEHIDYQTNALEKREGYFDFVFDAVGGSTIERSIPLIKSGGTLISIPTGISEAALARAKALNVEAYFYLVESNGDDMIKIADWLATGVIKPTVSKTFPFEDMALAHKAVESGRTIGKVVVYIK